MATTIDDYFERFGPKYRWIATLTVMCTSITTVLSATIVNVAVPDVMGTFGIGLSEVQWMSTAFIAAMVISQLLSAWAMDCFGPRVAFVSMLVLFATGALVASSAPNMEILAVGRTLQGLAAGIIQPIAMVVLALVFPPDRRGFAMGIYSVGLVFAPTLGPALGGITIDTLGWRYMLLIPIPVCVFALVAGVLFMPDREESAVSRRLDWLGVALLATAIVCILSTLSNGQRWGWLSDRTLIQSAIGGAAIWMFVLSQLRSDSPLLDFRVLANSQFASACLIAFVFGSALFATTYYIPVFVQTVLSYTPTQAGVLLIPAGMLLFVLLPITGRLADSVPAHYLIVMGLVLMALGFGLMAGADANSSFLSLVVFTMISRGGMGFVQPPLRTAAVRALPAAQLARGSGTLNFFRQLGGAFGISGLVIAVEQRTQLYSEAFSATQTSDNDTSRELRSELTRLLSEAGIPERLHEFGALRYLGDIIEAQARSLAFQDAATLIAAIFILTVLPALLLAKGRTTA